MLLGKFDGFQKIQWQSYPFPIINQPLLKFLFFFSEFFMFFIESLTDKQKQFILPTITNANVGLIYWQNSGYSQYKLDNCTKKLA